MPSFEMLVREPNVIFVDLCQVPKVALRQASRSCSPKRRSDAHSFADQAHKRNRQDDHAEDGGIISIPRKKRRLQHDLITSRLNKPYATPNAYIANRPALRNGVWARQKVPGRGLLRKAAILNLISMKRKTIAGTNAVVKTKEKERLVKTNGSRSQYRKTPVSRASLSPRRSPQNVTCPFVPPEYEDFDQENDDIDDQEQESNDSVYSDFNMLYCQDSDVEVYDHEYSFDNFDTGMYLNPASIGEKTMGLLMENERNDEVSVAP